MDYVSCLGYGEYISYYADQVLKVSMTFEMTPWIIASILLTCLLETGTIIAYLSHWVNDLQPKSTLSLFRKLLLAWSLLLYIGHLSFALNQGYMGKLNMFFVFHFEPEFMIAIFLFLSAKRYLILESTTDVLSVRGLMEKLPDIGLYSLTILGGVLISMLLVSRIALLVMSDLLISFKFNIIGAVSDAIMVISGIWNAKSQPSVVSILMAFTVCIHLIESITVTFLYCVSHPIALIIHFIDIPLTHFLLMMTMIYSRS